MVILTSSHNNFFAPSGAIGWVGGNSTHRETLTEESIKFYCIGSNDVEPPGLFLDVAKLHVAQGFRGELTGDSFYNLVFLVF